MNTTFTVILGIIAMLLPLFVGRLVWKRFDTWFGRNDEDYMNSLDHFLKKIGFTILVAFALLWLGMGLVFSGNGG
ncbi:hypothetical protein [Polynucleobacter sp. MWH-UH23A]|uniref:hypothetical protein n=1 Tax=Polynucleobacter sp. MWH-UH23A TaxID=1855613 RepID=UPI003364BD58